VSWLVTDAQVRKLGERTGLDTLVVLAVNDDHEVWGVSTPSVPTHTQSVVRLGSTVARLKLKGIDGDPHKQRSVWFNSMRREEPYQGLTCA
jgi:DNA-binding LacI/PurR family transcriptional regulator